MKSILKQLYEGEICPVGEVEPVLKEYREKESEFLRKERILICKLEKDLKPELNDLVVELYEMMSEEMAEAFAKGFSMGMRMAIEGTYGK